MYMIACAKKYAKGVDGRCVAYPFSFVLQFVKVAECFDAELFHRLVFRLYSQRSITLARP